MSWSDFYFDIFTPEMRGRLTTNTLKYSKGPQTPNNDDASCQGGSCTPDKQDLCKPTGLPEILYSAGGTSCSTNYLTSSTTCTQWQGSLCGVFDGVSTCAIAGIGTNHNNVLGTDWNVSMDGNWNTPNKGWVYCQYNFDYTDFNRDTGFLALQQWMQTLSQGESDSAPKGMDIGYMSRLCDTNLIYACILDFYNELYTTGHYKKEDSNNPFLSLDFFQEGFQDFTNAFMTYIKGNFSNPPYTGYGPPLPLTTAIQSALLPPKPNQNGDVYSLTFQLSYSQYQDYLNQGNKDGYISGLMNNILRDTEGVMGTLIPVQSWTPNGVNLINSTVDSISIIQVVDAKNVALYGITFGVDPKKFTQKDYNGYLFATAQITAIVDTWSPLLTIYFQIFNPNINFSENTCKKIASVAGYNSSYASTIPLSCLKQDCADAKTCNDSMGKYCVYEYNQTPDYTTRIAIDKYLVTQNMQDCMCYTSSLVPKNQTSAGNPGAMCFDKNCGKTILSNFGLSDATCATHCDEVWAWLNNPNIPSQSRNPESINWIRFNEVCGKNYIPYTPDSYNKQVLIMGVMVTVFSGLLAFSGGMHAGFGSPAVTTLVIVTILVLGGATGFACRDLAGIELCDGKGNPVCRSRITKQKIPLDFCNYTLDCECAFDGDCSTEGCVCVSGTCQPSVGTRKTKTIQEKRVNKLVLFGGIFLGIVLPIILIYLHDDYHWKISKKLFSLLVVICAIVPIAVSIGYSLKKYDRTVQAEPCPCSKGPCGDNNCGTDSCGQSCGKCGNGYACQSGTCVCVNGCEGKTCGKNSCGDDCGPPCPETVQDGVYRISNSNMNTQPITAIYFNQHIQIFTNDDWKTVTNPQQTSSGRWIVFDPVSPAPSQTYDVKDKKQYAIFMPSGYIYNPTSGLYFTAYIAGGVNLPMINLKSGASWKFEKISECPYKI
jgi:hypothetical protein